MCVKGEWRKDGKTFIIGQKIKYGINLREPVLVTPTSLEERGQHSINFRTK